MLSFTPADTAYQAEDKGLDFSAPNVEDPFNDFFNQLISPESSGSSDNANLSHAVDYLAFPTEDDTTSSGSNLGDHAYNIVRPQTVRPQRPRQANLRFTQSQEVLPSQAYQRLARLERPKAAISGAELLNLEGKIALQASPVRSNIASSSATPSNPPLRRKNRFSTISPETLRHRTHKISKSPGVGISDSTKMMRPSYYYRQETPSLHEWTERFEQISLQVPVHASTMSHPPPDVLFRDEKGPRNIALNPGSSMTDPNPLPSPTDFSNFEESSSQHPVMVSNEQRETRSRRAKAKAADTPAPPPPTRQPSSWIQPAVSTDSFDFTISPSEISSDWPSSLLDSSSDNYYGNVGATQSAPTLTHDGTAFPNFSNQGLMIQDHPLDQFITQDPSHDYFVLPSDPFQPTAFDVYPSIPPPATATGRPSSPFSPPPSPCPSPSSTSKSPSKTRRRSKSSRRKPSTRTLQSPTALGFVNFTPNDSKKILTGVAPSGSSKTKARREQEAHDNKRRMSLAAEQAVLDAGGDLKQFRASRFLK